MLTVASFPCVQVLAAADCQRLVSEMDAVADKMGWQDDGTGVKYQTSLPGHEGEFELFSTAARAAVARALEEQAVPLARRLFSCEGLVIRGQSAALIRYGSAALSGSGSVVVGVDGRAAGEVEVSAAESQQCGFERSAQPPRLEVHRDGAFGVTINILLSQPSAFTKGGTYFEGRSASEGIVVRPSIGHAIMHHRAMRHAGFPIELGLRHVLVTRLTVVYTARIL